MPLPFGIAFIVLAVAGWALAWDSRRLRKDAEKLRDETLLLSIEVKKTTEPVDLDHAMIKTRQSVEAMIAKTKLDGSDEDLQEAGLALVSLIRDRRSAKTNADRPY